MSEELQETTQLPIEEQISQELVKQNVTQAVISSLKERYGNLKIAGIDDKETYLLVKEGRKECKSFRVLAKKICEKGREEAVAIQKAWVAKQKEVTDEIASIEDPLEEQEKAFEAAVAKEKEDRKRRHEEQLIMRQQVLTGMGALYSDGSFHLGEVSFELSVVKESEPDIWEEGILPKFKEEYEKVEAERIEQERIKQEQEAEFKRKEEEINRKLKEIEEAAAALKLQKEEQERKQKEEEDRKAEEEKRKRFIMIETRCNELRSIGMVSKGWPDSDFFYEEIHVSTQYIEGATASGWAEAIDDINAKIQQKKEAAEQKRLAEIEEQKEAQRIKTLGKSRIDVLKQYGVYEESSFTEESAGKMPDLDWEIIRGSWQDVYEKRQKEKWEKEQEDKRKQDELNRQLELEQAKDKEKWEEIIRRVNEIEVYEMRSSQYRKKAMILREKLEEIKAL